MKRKEQKALEEFNEKHGRAKEITPEERAKEIEDFINLWRAQNYPQVPVFSV